MNHKNMPARHVAAALLLAAAPLMAQAQNADEVQNAPQTGPTPTPQYQPPPPLDNGQRTLPGATHPHSMPPNAAQPRPQDRARQSDRPAAGSSANTTTQPRSTLPQSNPRDAVGR
ncbi:hypothetical protein CEG14_25050 [Bordetella genomosp. 1]|uniref:Uncharacterized protein n=1 Tax=Bordetella genomosp. 1 TaxID=1395607 RepID=A0A261RT05_9BORD|nr:hypothetical protein [Bordetella genomosp. 1]OZI28184.1 hypothetical protein CEG14_25050 [Bordetella genomosp. 1]